MGSGRAFGVDAWARKPRLVEFVSLSKTAPLGPHQKRAAQCQQGHAAEYPLQKYIYAEHE